jgi:hypothetical protein
MLKILCKANVEMMMEVEWDISQSETFWMVLLIVAIKIRKEKCFKRSSFCNMLEPTGHQVPYGITKNSLNLISLRP